MRRRGYAFASPIALPAVRQDLALIVDESTPAVQVRDAMIKAGAGCCKGSSCSTSTAGAANSLRGEEPGLHAHAYQGRRDATADR